LAAIAKELWKAWIIGLAWGGPPGLAGRQFSATASKNHFIRFHLSLK
jgi:hypothetical protein